MNCRKHQDEAIYGKHGQRGCLDCVYIHKILAQEVKRAIEESEPKQSKRFFTREALKIAETAQKEAVSQHPHYRLGDIPVYELASFGKRFYGLTRKRLIEDRKAGVV